MVRALLMDENIRGQIRELIVRAALNVTPLEEVQRLAARRGSEDGAVTENPLHGEFTMTIPQGYVVTYTQEMQRPDVTCRHISIHVENARAGMGPHPAAVAMLLEEFGFKNKLGHLPAWRSKTPKGDWIIELIEPLDGNVNHLVKEA